jgi:hypothetical protein
MILRADISFQSRRWLRPLLAFAGLAISVQMVLAVRMYLTAFPSPTLTPTVVLRRLDALPQTNQPVDSQVLVGIEWATAATFRCRMTNRLDHQWTNALQEWRWFATWIPRVVPGQTNVGLRSRVLRMSEDGVTDAPFEVTPSSTRDPRAGPWSLSEVPLPTQSAEEAIARVEAYLRKQPTTQEEVLIVAADWTTPERFDHPRIRGGALSFYIWTPDVKGRWGWIISCVHRMRPNSVSRGGKRDRVELYRVKEDGQVTQPAGGGSL